jgi:hypothetical protein
MNERMKYRNHFREPAPPSCPECGMERQDWVGDGYSSSKDGQIYCCQGCAEGTGCICKDAQSREEVLAREQPRPGMQHSGALLPQGELSGEPDASGMEDQIDRSGGG